MATYTPNYNLIKPDVTDLVDVGDLNDNADIIDTTLAAKANLVGGKVPASELPSYVDDVIEGYYYNGAFYSDSGHTTPITGETGKIYIDLDTESCYRWTGTVFVQISSPESPLVEGYYYNGAFYEDAAHLTLITGETGKLYIDLPTNDVYRYSGADYVKLSTPESEIYWATYDTTLDAAGIAAAYAELQAAVSAGQMILLFVSPYTYYCSDFIGGVQPAFYFCNYDQFPNLRKYTFSSITGWSALSQATIATKTYVDTAIHDAGQLPQGTNQDDILVWDSVLQEWTTASYPSGSLPTGTTDDDILVWDDSNQEWDTRAKGSISNGNTGWVTGGDVYTELQNIPSMPSGSNAGDILVWNGSAWAAQQPSRLPSFYQEVEYVESTGTQRIDLGFTPSSNDTYILNAKFIGNGGVFGSFSESSKAAVGGLVGNGKLNLAYHTAYGTEQTINIDNAFHTIEMSDGLQKIDGETVMTRSGPFTFAPASLPASLFAVAQGWYEGNIRPSYNYGRLQVKAFQRYINGILAIDLIPCYHKVTGVIGFYNTADGTFKTNAGTGTFLKGADV